MNFNQIALPVLTALQVDKLKYTSTGALVCVVYLVCVREGLFECLRVYDALCACVREYGVWCVWCVCVCARVCVHA